MKRTNKAKEAPRGTKHGPWTILDTRRIYENEFFVVDEDRVVRPDGEEGTYATVTMQAGACVLPIDDDGRVLLTRQFRYALGRESIEAVAGAVDEGEEPIEAAKRELREELGVDATEWKELGVVHIDPAKIVSPAHLFVARGLSFTDADQDETEEIAPVAMALDEAVEAVLSGTITHSSTCIILLKALRLVSLDEVRGEV